MSAEDKALKALMGVINRSMVDLSKGAQYNGALWTLGRLLELVSETNSESIDKLDLAEIVLVVREEAKKKWTEK